MFTNLPDHPNAENYSYMWLIMVSLHYGDLCLRRIGSTVRWIYSFDWIFIIQQILSTAAICYCSLETLQKSLYMKLVFGGIISVNVCTITFYYYGQWNAQVLQFFQFMRTHLSGFFFILQACGVVAVLVGFVKLTEELDKHQGYDIYLAGFFFGLCINFATLCKILRLHDVFGIFDGLITLSVYISFKFQTLIKIIMWVGAVILEMFKMAGLRLAAELPAQGEEALLPTQGEEALDNQHDIMVTLEHGFGQHSREIKGIALLPRSGLLYSASQNGKVEIYNSSTFHTMHSFHYLEEVGSLISKAGWVFVGMRNHIKACKAGINNEMVNITRPYTNILPPNRLPVETMISHITNQLLGLVTAMVYAEECLFVGTGSGHVSYWSHEARGSVVQSFRYIDTLKDKHDDEVTCLVVEEGRIFSGSADHSIKVWSLAGRKCVQTIRQHSDTVSSMVYWNHHLLSASLDKTVKTWELVGENWNVVSTQTKGQSVHALCVMEDLDGRQLILCSYQNGTVGIYSIPTFVERGSFSAISTVDCFTVGSEGLVFTGGKSGKMQVWRLSRII